MNLVVRFISKSLGPIQSFFFHIRIYFSSNFVSAVPELSYSVIVQLSSGLAPPSSVFFPLSVLASSFSVLARSISMLLLSL